MEIDKILNQFLPIGRRTAYYCVPLESNIKEVIKACVNDAIDEYYKDIDMSKQNTTYSKYFKSGTYKDMIESLISNIQTKKKMTVKDIENKLGYSVEIISD